MAPKLIRLNYREIAEQRGNDVSSDLPSLRDAIADFPQDNEQKIISYLENAPTYSAKGEVVRDALDPENGTSSYSATNTDGVYLWPAELADYVRKYHVRLPQQFLTRMESLGWRPPKESEINFEERDAELTVNYCAKLLRAHTNGMIDREFLLYNLTLHLVHGAMDDIRFGSRLRGGWKPSLELLSPELLREWIEWMEREVVALDFMPCPNPFLPDTRDTAAAEAKRRELRQFYIALYDLIRK